MSSCDDSEWGFASRIEPGKNRWVALLTIPFRTLNVLPPTAGGTSSWRLNLGRVHVAGPGRIERSIWSANPASTGVADRTSFGEVAF